MSNSTLSTIDVAHQLVALCRTGRFIEAQTSLMAPDCEQIEPARAIYSGVRGLSAIIQKEKQMQATIVETHSVTVSEPIVAGHFFSISLHFDLTLRGPGRIQLDELGVYEVQNGKIVREQFFY